MGLLNMLSNFRDLFEIGRKTTSDTKNNKPKERKYQFNDGKNIPSSRSEYKKLVNRDASNKENREEEDLEL